MFGWTSLAHLSWLLLLSKHSWHFAFIVPSRTSEVMHARGTFNTSANDTCMSMLVALLPPAVASRRWGGARRRLAQPRVG